MLLLLSPLESALWGAVRSVLILLEGLKGRNEWRKDSTGKTEVYHPATPGRKEVECRVVPKSQLSFWESLMGGLPVLETVSREEGTLVS